MYHLILNILWWSSFAGLRWHSRKLFGKPMPRFDLDQYGFCAIKTDWEKKKHGIGEQAFSRMGQQRG